MVFLIVCLMLENLLAVLTFISVASEKGFSVTDLQISSTTLRYTYCNLLKYWCGTKMLTVRFITYQTHSLTIKEANN